MPSFDYHCEECVRKLGKPFEEVHKWLDEFFMAKWLPLLKKTRHRQFRHHKEGIEQVRKMWGNEAAKAAEIHIRADLDSDNYPKDNPIPLNQKHFESMGLQ